MTHKRFVALVDAYGGHIDRWPATEQDAALAYLDTHRLARELLARAASLDAALACWNVPGPGAVLSARIIEIATRRNLCHRRLRLWLSGVGTAATLAGGLATGASVVAFRVPAANTAFNSLYQLSVLGMPVELAEHPAEGNAP